MAARTCNRVAVTGLGIACGLGRGPEKVFQRLCDSDSGIRVLEKSSARENRVWVGAPLQGSLFQDMVSLFTGLDVAPDRLTDRLTALVVHDALSMAGLLPLPKGLDARTGLVTVCGSGEIRGFESRLEEWIRPKASDEWGSGGIKAVIASTGRLAESCSDWCSYSFGITGPRLNLVTACSSGLVGIVRAYEWIRTGMADVVVAAGSDVVSKLCFNGFKSLGAMDDQPCRPFDAKRNGMNLGEGGGALVLENMEHASARGAALLAEVAGYGLRQDARHVASPDPTGGDWAAPIKDALKSAGKKPEDISYINAHGTGTRLNDLAETRAVKIAFKDAARRIPVSSVKAALGHCQFAAGAVEAVVTVTALNEGMIPPTLRLEHPDPECDLDYVPNQARKVDLASAMTLSFGFGGTSAAVIFDRCRP